MPIVVLAQRSSATSGRHGPLPLAVAAHATLVMVKGRLAAAGDTSWARPAAGRRVVAVLSGPRRRTPLTTDDPRLSRIADTTVAEQYFNATSAVETAAPTLATGPAVDDAPANTRLLANGHCTRPRELDCRFQTICEGCGFFQTDAQFVPILRRRRDDAASHGDHPRMRIYDELVRVIDEQHTATND